MVALHVLGQADLSALVDGRRVRDARVHQRHGLLLKLRPDAFVGRAVVDDTARVGLVEVAPVPSRVGHACHEAVGGVGATNLDEHLLVLGDTEDAPRVLDALLDRVVQAESRGPPDACREDRGHSEGLKKSLCIAFVRERKTSSEVRVQTPCGRSSAPCVEFRGSRLQL